MRFFVTESPFFVDWSAADASLLSWSERALRYGNWTDRRHLDATIPVTPGMLLNGTLYGHLFLFREGASPDPKHADYRSAHVAYSRHGTRGGGRQKPGSFGFFCLFIEPRGDSAESVPARAQGGRHQEPDDGRGL